MNNELPDTLLSDTELATLIKGATSVAVVGVSAKPDRASNQIAEYLIKETDLEVLLVNPLVEELWGGKVYSSLGEATEALGRPIDIVDAFRKSEDIPALAGELSSVGAKTLWMQLGIRNDDESARLRDAGIEVIQNRCIKIEIEKLRAHNLL